MTTALIITLALAYIFASFVKIPVGHLAMVTTLGKRNIDANGNVKVVEEGWKFVPWLIKDLIVINLFQKQINITMTETTPDGTNNSLEFLIVYIPSKKYINTYFISGQSDGVNKRLIAKTEDRSRKFISGNEEGPQDFRELKQSKAEMMGVLLRKIADDDTLSPLPDYAQNVPTWIWLRYYTKPRPKIFLEKEKFWAENDWTEVKKVEAELSASQLEELKKELKTRMSIVDQISSGTANIEVESLGIIIQQISLPNVQELGEVAEAFAKKAKEEEERKAEEVEISHFAGLTKTLVDAGFSKSDAKEIIQSERGKVPMNIDVKKVRLDTSEGLEEIIKLFNKGGK